MFKTSFDDILELCLDRLEAGDTIESCLHDYPTEAEALRGPLEIANQFRSLPIEKPSLAADFFFQQQLDQLTAESCNTQKGTQRYVENIFNRLRKVAKGIQEPILELGFMTLMVAIVALVFISRANLIDQEPATLLIAKETLTYADLGNMAYDAVLVGSIRLEDGRYSLATNSEKGTQHFIYLDRQMANGDLDGDGWEDAAALLFWRDESAIPLWSLVVVRNDRGEPENIASTFLGPNLKVESLEIINGLIHISASDQYGTVFTKIYQLDRSTLVLLEEFSEFEPQSVQKEELIEQLEPDFDGSSNPILMTNRLGSLSYPIEGRTVLFKEGIAYGEYFSTRILDSQSVYGDLTGDGKDESVAALLTQTSGSESIYFLSVVTDGDAEAVPIISLAGDDIEAVPISLNSLGDRIRLDSVQVKDGEIVIELFAEAEGEFPCCSAMETTYKFELVENKLIALSTN